MYTYRKIQLSSNIIIKLQTGDGKNDMKTTGKFVRISKPPPQKDAIGLNRIKHDLKP